MFTQSSLNCGWVRHNLLVQVTLLARYRLKQECVETLIPVPMIQRIFNPWKSCYAWMFGRVMRRSRLMKEQTRHHWAKPCAVAHDWEVREYPQVLGSPGHLKLEPQVVKEQAWSDLLLTRNFCTLTMKECDVARSKEQEYYHKALVRTRLDATLK